MFQNMIRVPKEFEDKLVASAGLCWHDPSHVTADICEGDAVWRGHPPSGADYTIQWCRKCGAYKRNDGEWSPSAEGFVKST